MDIDARAKIWLDMGTNEGSNPHKVLEEARILRNALRKKGWQDGVDLNYVEAEGAEHNEAAWRDRVGPMLQWLFGLRS